MARNRKSEIRAFIGGKGSGKTYLAIREARKARRVLVWDSVGEWTDEKHLRDAAHFGDLRELARHLQSGGRMFPKTVVVARRDDFLAFCSFAYKWAKTNPGKGQSLLVLEELNAYVHSNKRDHQFLDLVDRSRHASLDVLMIAPRMYGIPLYAREQVDRWKIAQVWSPGELAKFGDEYGPDVRDRLSKLPKHRFLEIIKGQKP